MSLARLHVEGSASSVRELGILEDEPVTGHRRKL